MKKRLLSFLLKMTVLMGCLVTGCADDGNVSASGATQSNNAYFCGKIREGTQ